MKVGLDAVTIGGVVGSGLPTTGDGVAIAWSRLNYGSLNRINAPLPNDKCNSGADNDD